MCENYVMVCKGDWMGVKAMGIQGERMVCKGDDGLVCASGKIL